ncbi:MAG: phosphoenolpyruvate-protein phosphotransferase PtsP [Gammaproteobacteria bacterium]|nr:MAG: phosphoenolpyruvate-protein phosphotransferase PtsP [Gammaproteobacteria bacterium]
MLESLRRIVQEVNAARNLEQALAIIVQRVKQAMAADVCSVYLADPVQQHYVLMATDGLNPEAVGTVRLKLNEGLVGVVGERAEPLNLDNAPDHPRYRFVAETGEERYHAFLGVPIIHHRQVLGVLVVRQRARRKFDENEETLLVTIAAQLAGGIAHAQASGGLNNLQHGNRGAQGRAVAGLPGAPGIGIGQALVIYPPTDLDAIPDRKSADVAAEIKLFERALSKVRGDIEALAARLRATLPEEDIALFDAYLHMLRGESLAGKTIARIRAGQWAPGALRDTILEHTRAFEAMGDAYLSERASDVRDLGLRILAYLQADARRNHDYPPRTVIVGEEVSATALAEVPKDRLAGVVSVRGSSSSHVAILARAMGVPAVMGAADLNVIRVDGREVVVDGYRGQLYLDPTPVVRAEYQRIAHEEQTLAAGLSELRDLPAVTRDGHRVPLYANTGLLSDITPTLNSGAEGIGLYRTEFPFMTRERFPGEEEQRVIYRQVLEAFHPRPVVLRTLDIGGDKSLPYFPIEEDNPFLGWRGIRISLDHPEIFIVQLRAMLRASRGLNNLHLLLPMISALSEVDEALRLIRRVHDELNENGETPVMPRVGVMIEVPSAVYQADAIAARVDFLSVGSNDLTQYLLAVDRNNARVASLYDALHPAVLRALMQVVEGAHRHEKPVSVCGEMAGDPAAALLLLGMGMDSLSMSVASLPRVKWMIRNFSRDEARRLLDEALQLHTTSAIRLLLHAALQQAGLGGLIRAA